MVGLHPLTDARVQLRAVHAKPWAIPRLVACSVRCNNLSGITDDNLDATVVGRSPLRDLIQRSHADARSQIEGDEDEV